MDGAVHTGSVSLGTVATSWNIVGSADFNGDGQADILWQNTSGSRAVWFMNGTAFGTGVYLPFAAPSWSIVGSGDFNRDGKPDILWQSSTGARAIWLMNGTARMSSVNLPAVATIWNIVGAADFNGDGQVDILWQNNSGARAVWLMNGTNYVERAYLGEPSAHLGTSGITDCQAGRRHRSAVQAVEDYVTACLCRISTEPSSSGPPSHRPRKGRSVQHNQSEPGLTEVLGAAVVYS